MLEKDNDSDCEQMSPVLQIIIRQNVTLASYFNVYPQQLVNLELCWSKNKKLIEQKGPKVFNH